MTIMKKTSLIWLGVVIVLGLGIIYAVLFRPTFGGSYSINQRQSFKEIGAAAAPLNLTANFADAAAVSSTALDVRGMSRMVVGGSYVTKNQVNFLTMKLQLSVDDGVTYFDYSVPQAPNTAAYGANPGSTLGGTSSTFMVVGSTSTMGIPFNIGGPIVTSGTTVSFYLPPIAIAADFIKIFFQENTTGTHGTLYSQVFLTN